jgi:hypothetical protein
MGRVVGVVRRNWRVYCGTLQVGFGRWGVGVGVDGLGVVWCGVVVGSVGVVAGVVWCGVVWPAC